LLQSKTFLLGWLSGTIYDFPEVGDELGRHTHTENDVHITIVSRGRVLVLGDGWEREVSAGAFLDWEPGVYHTFRSLEPNSRIVNIVKGM
jgi:quercetin dioxygenase-like cupin family protein